MLDQQSFELIPSSADFDYPKYETDRKLLQSKLKNDSGNEKAKSLKNIMSRIVRKHEPVQGEQEPISKQFQGQAAYEFDGQKNQEVQLRGRMFKPINDESFLIVQKLPEPDYHNPKRPSPLTPKRNSDLVNSETPSIIRVMPHSSSTSNSPKSPNRYLNDFTQTSQAERSSSAGSDEILRCPACFRAFKASTEHYKLLQHMDSCGQWPQRLWHLRSAQTLYSPRVEGRADSRESVLLVQSKVGPKSLSTNARRVFQWQVTAFSRFFKNLISYNLIWVLWL